MKLSNMDVGAALPTREDKFKLSKERKVDPPLHPFGPDNDLNTALDEEKVHTRLARVLNMFEEAEKRKKRKKALQKSRDMKTLQTQAKIDKYSEYELEQAAEDSRGAFLDKKM